ncbi:endospore germination permease [Paenibacillus sp. SI8]|uniref:GerAB/ArcD/ProY family transporter n=1 Tax=unclassified Paenibacillus TaxID=185978 RepID=UPI0034656355
MLEKGQISAFQMGLIMYPVILATGFLSLPAISAQYARNDLWLSPLVASVSGFISIFVALRLHALYPKLTIAQYSELIVGRWIGKAIGIVVIIFLVHITGIIVREYADFVTGCFLVKTPTLMVVSSIILLAAFAVRGGVELLARSALIFTPIFILPIIVLLLLIPDLDVTNLFPVLDHGWIPVFKGAATPQAWFSEFYLISFFLPSLSDPHKGKKWSVISLCAVVLSLTYVNLITLFLLGPDTGIKMYPVLNSYRYISFGHFFENTESLLLAMWVVGNFIKIGGFYYAATHSLGAWLKMTDIRPLVFPVGLLTIISSFWDLPNFSRMGSYISTVLPFEIPAVFILIPLFLLLVATIRKRKVAGMPGKESSTKE